MGNILSAITAHDNPSPALMRADQQTGMNNRQLGAFVSDMTVQLQQLGLRRHHKVALALSEGEPSTVTALLATINTSIAAPMRRFENDEMTDISLDTIAPDVLVLDETVPNYSDIALLASAKNIPVITLHPENDKNGKFTLRHNTDLSNLSKGEIAEPTEDDIAVLFQTSGTTGTPKLVAHTHGHFLHNARIHTNTVGIHKNELRCLNVLSQRAQWGVTTALTTLLSGGTLMVYPHTNLNYASTGETKLAHLIETTQSNWVPLTPSNLVDLAGLMHKRPGIGQKLRDSALQVLETSSSSAHPMLLEQVQNELPLISLLQTYGSTETGPISANTSRNNKTGTVGCAVDGVEIKIVNGAGKQVADGEMGELWVRSPSVARYYQNDEANRKSYTEDGFYKTGDIVALDADGHITIVGRKSEIFVVNDREVIPAALDKVAQTIPAVKEAATFPVTNEGQTTVGMILAIGEGTNPADAAESLRQTLGDIPVHIFFASKIPQQYLTSKGSLRRGVMTQELSGRAGNAPEIHFLELDAGRPASVGGPGR